MDKKNKETKKQKSDISKNHKTGFSWG